MMRFIRMLMYIAGFFILFFLITSVFFIIIGILSPILNCGGFDCLDKGFAVVIGGFMLSFGLSLWIIWMLHWRYEIHGRQKPVIDSTIIPIFVLAEDGLEIFPNVRAAESHMEAIDVRNGVYIAVYDREGNRFRITTTPDNFVKIRPIVPSQNRAAELSFHLRNFIRTLRDRNKINYVSDEWLDEETLSELVNESLEFMTK